MKLTIIRKLFPERMPDFWVRHYDKDVAGKIFLGQFKKIAEEIPIDSGLILDIGTGTGYLPIEINKKKPGLKVIGIDLSKRMIEVAKGKKKEINNVEFMVMDAKSLGFRENSISFIISTKSFLYWKRPLRVFNEIYQILKPGSQAWIYEASTNLSDEDLNRNLSFEFVFSHLKFINKIFPSKIFLKKIIGLHSFSEIDYKSEIEPIINKSLFKKGMLEKKGMWHRISLKKE